MITQGGTRPGGAGRLLLAAALALAVSRPGSAAVSYYLATDVPATLGGLTYLPRTIVRSDGALYSVALTLPVAEIAAIHRRADGVWLVAGAAPFFIGSTPVRTSDVLSTPDGATLSLFFDGASAGVPGDVGIDALLLDAGGDLVLSFNAPVRLGGMEYGASDLVRYSGGVFSLYWSAAAAGVPASSNLVGADRDSGGGLVVTFDVPTLLAGTSYLPGQLVRWNGGTSFSSYFADPAWPAYAQLRNFSFVPAAGAVPDGGGVPGTPLTVKLTGGALTLSWAASCATGDDDYEIYEGTLGQPFAYNHTGKLCTTGGATTATFAAPAGSSYYLVVPRNAVSEGSYGQASGGAEVPPGAAACAPQQIALACP